MILSNLLNKNLKKITGIHQKMGVSNLLWLRLLLLNQLKDHVVSTSGFTLREI
ncbi:hypothetical protein D357_00012 [Enterococcus faecium SD3B-2]|nr:hypothetical protein D357_00012 [Enterococcus faecium SD3B-2]